jgi:two-component system OmpR family response regulator
MKILLVDDDPDIRRIGALSLEKVGGFAVVLAASGAEALGKLEQEHFDLILLDMMMPDMDGIATLTAERARPAERVVPVIFMTAKVQGGEVDRYLRAGALGVIEKPFDPLALPGEVRRILAQSAGAQPSRSR